MDLLPDRAAETVALAKGERAWPATDRSAHRAPAEERRIRAVYEKRRLRLEAV